MRRVSIIVNPASDNGETGRLWPRMARGLRTVAFEYEVSLTDGPGHATRLAAEAAQRGCDVVLYVGGDGTANEVVNGLMTAPAESRPALAALPRGTGADLPRALQLERGVQAAVDRLLHGRRRYMDIAESYLRDGTGEIRHRYFANMADVGLGGHVAARVNARSKAFGGFVSFLSAILSSFWSYENSEMRVVIDGETRFQGRAASVVVANGPFFAGGMKMAPRADPWDGVLDVVVLGDVDKRDLAANLVRLYRGRHDAHSKVHMHRGRSVLVDAEEAVPIEMDGEHPGFAPFHVRVAPRSLPVII